MPVCDEHEALCQKRVNRSDGEYENEIGQHRFCLIAPPVQGTRADGNVSTTRMMTKPTASR